MCWNCVYHCKAFILVRKAIALKSVAFTLDLKQGLCAQKLDKGGGVGKGGVLGTPFFKTVACLGCAVFCRKCFILICR